MVSQRPVAVARVRSFTSPKSPQGSWSPMSYPGNREVHLQAQANFQLGSLGPLRSLRTRLQAEFYGQFWESAQSSGDFLDVFDVSPSEVRLTACDQ